jgi:hypothetical protein
MSNASWWANKLGQQAPAPSLPPKAVQPAFPINHAGMRPNLPQVSPPEYVENTTDQYQPTKTTFNRNQDLCPACGSGNYFKSPDPRSNSGHRCFECGYPVVHQTSNMPSVPSPEGQAVKAARQVSTANNYNPQVIVDRIE